MIWLIRGGLLTAMLVVLGLALGQATAPTGSPPAAQPAAPATQPGVLAPQPTPATQAPLATRVPLPTLAPERIVSRVVRTTPEPAAAAPPTVTSPPQVAVVDFGFQPVQARIAAGARVSWTNAGREGHDIAGDGPDGAWHSGPLAPGEQYARAFDRPGTFAYACSIHPEMRGQVLVDQRSSR